MSADDYIDLDSVAKAMGVPEEELMARNSETFERLMRTMPKECTDEDVLQAAWHETLAGSGFRAETDRWNNVRFLKIEAAQDRESR
jgi:hypothetical protein